MVSQIQEQYPLVVTRKYWKKVFTRSWLVVLLAVIAGISYSLLNGVVPFSIIPLLIIVAIYLVFFIPYSIYILAYINRYYYDLGADFITIKKGVLAPSEIHVQYYKIQDVYVDQDVLDRIFGIYDVHIASATATSSIEAHIDGVNYESAEGLKNIILSKITGGQERGPGNLSNDGNPVSSVPIVASGLSSKEYPIEQRWLIKNFVGSFFVYCFYFLFIGLVFLSKTNNNSSLSVSPGLIITISIGIIIIAATISLVWSIIWKENYYFEFTPDYILLRTGVIAKQEKHLPYTAIQNVTAKQRVMDRIFGLMNVVIENAALIRVGTVSVSDSVVIPGQIPEKANMLLSEINNIMASLPKRSQTGL